MDTETTAGVTTVLVQHLVLLGNISLGKSQQSDNSFNKIITKFWFLSISSKVTKSTTTFLLPFSFFSSGSLYFFDFLDSTSLKFTIAAVFSCYFCGWDFASKASLDNHNQVCNQPKGKRKNTLEMFFSNSIAQHIVP